MIRVVEQHVEVDGVARLIATGEVHYSRVPRALWPQALADLRAMGCDGVASYLFWNHHHPRQDQQPDFTGNRDLAAFIREAVRAGLGVVLRIGPWVHGEARYGGLPDWVATGPWQSRTDDPDYLAVVRPWFAAVQREVDAVGWEHVMGIQVENELQARPDHLATLNAMAREVGFRAPLWFATGWGGASFDRDTLLPVYGGYSDTFWSGHTLGWESACASSFVITSYRDDHVIGTDLAISDDHRGSHDDSALPWLTCELGGGMATAYHRRPVVGPRDVGALAVTKVANGVAWLGYYMAHGGINPEFGMGPLMESHDTGYANDLPLRDYDFQAPLGASGQWRDHGHELRQLHAGIQCLGPGFAAALSEAVDPHPDPLDTSRWRVAVRAAADADGVVRGAVVFNNHQPHTSMPHHRGVSVTVAGVGQVPSKPVDVAPGEYGMWPVNLELAPGVTLRCTTAQPVGRCVADGVTTWLFKRTISGPAIFELAGGEPVDAPEATTELFLEVSEGCRILLLPRGQEHRYWVVGGELLRGPGAVTMSEGRMRWRSWTPGALEHHRGGWEPVAAHPAAGAIPVHVETVRPASPVTRAHGRLAAQITPSGDEIAAGGRPSAPLGDAFADAARFRVTLPEERGPEDWLELRWRGDVLRVTEAGGDPALDADVVADQFWFGDGLLQVPAALVAPGVAELEVAVLPLPEGSDVMASGQERVAALDSAAWIRVAATEVAL